MNPPSYKVYFATIPGTDQELRRRSNRVYTHVVYCPPFVAKDGTHYLDTVSFCGSLALAEGVANRLGYEKVEETTNHYGRIIWKSAGERTVTPVILPLNVKIV